MVRRLGMLAPSSNTVLEPETFRLLPADGSVTAHVARFRVTQISAGAASGRQFETARLLEAAAMLADARVDLILWNGTAAGWRGCEWDARRGAAIEARTGIPTTTAVMALNRELGRLGARRIGLVTPYVGAIESRIIATYRTIGVEVASAVRRDLTDNAAYGEITPGEIADMVRVTARVPVDAVVILCTNLAGASIAPGLAGELGVPVLDSVRVAVEHSLAVLAALRGPARRA